MGAAREMSIVEKEFRPIREGLRSLDLMIWFKSGSFPQHKLINLDEEIEDFDFQWKIFKKAYINYKENTFIEKI